MSSRETKGRKNKTRGLKPIYNREGEQMFPPDPLIEFSSVEGSSF